MPIQIALIDAGPLIAYYDGGDAWHKAAKDFFDKFRGQLVTSEPIVTEVMWLLKGTGQCRKSFI